MSVELYGEEFTTPHKCLGCGAKIMTKTCVTCKIRALPLKVKRANREKDTLADAVLFKQLNDPRLSKPDVSEELIGKPDKPLIPSDRKEKCKTWSTQGLRVFH
jgi:hypothetical protein